MLIYTPWSQERVRLVLGLILIRRDRDDERRLQDEPTRNLIYALLTVRTKPNAIRWTSS